MFDQAEERAAVVRLSEDLIESRDGAACYGIDKVTMVRCFASR